MRVFSDRHHIGLYKSLRMLFVDRLGYELYCPTGKEWYTEGYWKIGDPYEDPWVAVKQYLESDETKHKSITLEDFKKTKFDILIASIPEHIAPYKKLIEKYQRGAKLVFQIGNTGWSKQAEEALNIMASADVDVPEGSHFIEYHQEFDLDIFYKGEPHQNKNIYSFIHCMPRYPDWVLFLELERALPEFKFRSFGAECRDGRIYGTHKVANKMRESMWTIHLKTMEGEGYGHVMHNTFAVGRPVIIRRGNCIGKIAEPLLVEGKSCLSVDSQSVDEIAKMIREFSKPTIYKGMSKYCRDVFDSVVDFDEEEGQIRKFLACLR